MRASKPILLVLAGLLLVSAGCSLTKAVTHNVLSGPCQCLLEWREDHRNSRMARDAWNEFIRTAPCRRYSDDYADGFEAGFSDYVKFGEPGEPPALPPHKYWHLKYQSAPGLMAIQQWFAGFHHGAEVARTGGYRRLITLPLAPRKPHATIETVRLGELETGPKPEVAPAPRPLQPAVPDKVIPDHVPAPQPGPSLPPGTSLPPALPGPVAVQARQPMPPTKAPSSPVLEQAGHTAPTLAPRYLPQSVTTAAAPLPPRREPPPLPGPTTPQAPQAQVVRVTPTTAPPRREPPPLPVPDNIKQAVALQPPPPLEPILPMPQGIKPPPKLEHVGKQGSSFPAVESDLLPPWMEASGSRPPPPLPGMEPRRALQRRKT